MSGTKFGWRRGLCAATARSLLTHHQVPCDTSSDSARADEDILAAMPFAGYALIEHNEDLLLAARAVTQ